MSIPASQIVKINPRLLTSGGTDLEFNGLFLSTSDKIPSTQIVLPFPDPESVGKYFGEDSYEYVASTVYFNGYNNSFKKPRAIYFASFPKSDKAAYIRGGALDGLPSEILQDLKTITSGSLELTLGPGKKFSYNLDFSSATSLSDIAKTIQDALVPPVSAATYTELASGPINVSSLIGITNGSFLIKVDGTWHGVYNLQVNSSSNLATIASDIQYKLGNIVTVDFTAIGITIASASEGTSGTISFAASPAVGTDVSDLLCLTSSTGAAITPGVDTIYPVDHVKVEFSSLYNAFVFTSSIAGSGSSVSYADGSIAELLKLTENEDAVLSTGVAAQSLTKTLNDVLDITENFVCFTTLWEASEAEALELAQWSTSKGVNYLYVFWDSSDSNLKSGTTTIADKMIAANVGSTCAVYNSLENAAMIIGTAASIDWERRQGTITFAFKSQEGIAANVVTGLAAQNLNNRLVNYMGDYATRNDNFVFLYQGCMFGTWKWIDTYLNAVWLINALQVSILSGFTQTPRVPYNDDGYTLIRAWCEDVLKRALYNGVIDPGISLSESVKAELFREAGVDITQELDIEGYYLQIKDPAPTVRFQRQSPECSLWYTYGGSVHKVEVASTVIV